MIRHSAFAALAMLLGSAGSAVGAQASPATVELATPVAGQPAVDGERPSGSESSLDRRTREVASELRCPVCQGESIQESPAELAQEMKALVRDQLAAGRTPDEVKAYFVERYGEWILLRPTTSGVNALLYWLPPIVLVAGGGLVVVLARRWTQAARTADKSTIPSPDDA